MSGHNLIQDYQQKHLLELLRHLWRNSPFYREYYESYGIHEKDLPELTIEDLPFLTKKILMENFDAAVIDRQIRKKDVERWIHERRDPRQISYRDFIVFNSSGSSGDVGIFLYDKISWQVMNAMIAKRLPQPENYPSGKTRVACYNAWGIGMPGSVTSALQLPEAVYEVLMVSLLDPPERVASQLNAFQPHRIIGYSSSVTAMAELAILGQLEIRPKRIFATGDRLNSPMRKKIETAWDAPVDLLYCSSESVYLAIQECGQEEWKVLDKLNIVEILDDDDQAVQPGGYGRVVLTNLYNYALPILRYELGDYAIRGAGRSEGGSTTIRDIRGRVGEALPVIGRDGKQDSIHPIVLAEFYAVGLETVQFVSLRPDYVRLDYMAETDIDDAVRMAFRHLLDKKGALETRIEVRRVDHIPKDLRTGKLRLVRTESEHEPQASSPLRENG